jgi:hypothetical protein
MGREGRELWPSLTETGEDSPGVFTNTIPNPSQNPKTTENGIGTSYTQIAD